MMTSGVTGTHVRWENVSRDERVWWYNTGSTVWMFEAKVASSTGALMRASCLALSGLD